MLAGRDLLAGAQTGTGKTAAFALPVLQRLAPQANTSVSPARHPVRALVLTPTRELAVQVYESFRDYGRHLALRAAVVYGGVDMDAQVAELRRGVEVLVATPGRLLDHMQQRTVMLQQVSILVLDEADRMLDMGFLPDLKRILSLLPPRRQNLLFSATFPDEIRVLARQLLHDAAEVQVAPRHATAEGVHHVVHPVARQKKRELLCHLVRIRDLRQVLVFCGTRIGANRLAHQLRRDHLRAEAIHGDKTQAEREAALAAFKSGRVQVLVATDVASRGLDIEGLPQVVNFDIPRSPEDYVHRVGRTGRAGMQGEAISLVSPDEADALAAIEKHIRRRIERVIAPGFEPDGPALAALVGREDGRHTRPAPAGPAAKPATAPQPAAREGRPATPPPVAEKRLGAASTPASRPPRAGSGARRRERPLAALLGGLKRAAT